jgi:hypothetical protein
MLVTLVALSLTVIVAQEQAEPIEQTLPAAAILLDGMVEAVGGIEAYEAVKTVVSKGSIELRGVGIRGEIAIYQARANFRVELSVEGLGDSAQGINGDVAWEVSMIQGPRLLTGDEKEFAKRTATFDANVLWREHFASAETIGTAALGETTCLLVKMTPKQGDPETWWIDQGSMRVVKVELKLKHAMGEFPAEITFSDYHEVEGVTLPFRSTQKVMGQEMVTVLDKIEINTELDDSVFDLPQEIVDLLAGATDVKHGEVPKVVEEPETSKKE